MGIYNVTPVFLDSPLTSDLWAAQPLVASVQKDPQPVLANDLGIFVPPFEQVPRMAGQAATC